VQKHALDNSNGTGDFVVVGFDRRSRWQLDSLAVTRCFGRVDSATDHGTPSCSLTIKLPKLFPDGAFISNKGEVMRYEDEVKGKGKQVAGTAKEKLGKLTGNRDLEDRGNQEQVEGKVQQKVGKARRKIGEAVEDLGERIAS